MKKTSLMQSLERRHKGKDIREIVRDACRKHPRIEGAAYELGISVQHLRIWRKRMGITDDQPQAVA